MDRQNVTTGFPHERLYTRRGVARLVGGGLLMLTGTAVEAKKKKKKPKYKVVTRTFVQPEMIVIGALGRADPYGSTIKVSGLKQGKVLDVNVRFGFFHQRPSDVDIQLLAPNGRRATIMSDAGIDSGLGGHTLTLDDEAGKYLPEFNALLPDSYKPTNYPTWHDSFAPPGGPTTHVRLSTFDGINPNGTWQLLVYDDQYPYGGAMDFWELIIKVRVRK